jgi:hypothetical protein
MIAIPQWRAAWCRERVSRPAIALVLLVLAACPSNAPASYLELELPVAPVTIVSRDDRFQMTIEGAYGSVTSKTEPARVRWRSFLPGFDRVYARVFLVSDGGTIVVVRGNEQVIQVNDVAVYVIRESGDVLGIPASRFTTKLVRPEKLDSVNPHQRWLESVVEVTDDTIVVVNAEGERRSVKLVYPQ